MQYALSTSSCVLATMLLASSPVLLAFQSEALPSRIEGSAVREDATSVPGVTLDLRMVGDRGPLDSVIIDTAVTDAAGRFLFDNLSPGQYSVVLPRGGFVLSPRVERLQRLLVEPDSRHTVRVIVVPLSVISGRVLDEYGEPLPRASVQAMQVTYRDGKRELVAAGNGPSTADDFGRYRVADLPPGEYYLQVSTFRETGFVPVYYPGRLRPESATVVRIPEGGIDVPAIDIQFPAVETYTVRFQVQSIGLVSEAPNLDIPIPTELAARRFMIRPESAGRFEAPMDLLGVDRIAPDTYVTTPLPPGRYEIAIGAGEYPLWPAPWTRVDVNIVDGNVDLGTVVVGPGYVLNGRIDTTRLSRPIDLSQLPVFFTMHPLDGMGILSGLTLTESGNFQTGLLSNGTYRVDVTVLPGEDVFVESIRYNNGMEALYDGLQVAGQPSGPIEIVLADDGGVVEGVVLDADDNPFRGTVILIPAPNRRGAAAVFPTTVSNASGAYSIRGVPAGDYRVLAIYDISMPPISRGSPYQDPLFLEEHAARAEQVNVGPNSRIRVNPSVVHVLP